MEDKLQKRKVKRLIFTLFCLIIGGIIYSLLFDNRDGVSKFIF